MDRLTQISFLRGIHTCSGLSEVRRVMRSETLDAEAVFEGSNAVSGYGELRVLNVLEGEDYSSGEP